MKGCTTNDLIKMLKRLHRDNERDTVAGIREGDCEYIVLHRIHERNKVIHTIFQLLSEIVE